MKLQTHAPSPAVLGYLACVASAFLLGAVLESFRFEPVGYLYVLGIWTALHYLGFRSIVYRGPLRLLHKRRVRLSQTVVRVLLVVGPMNMALFFSLSLFRTGGA